MHVLTIHLPDKQTHGADHDRGIRRLDADHHIGEILFDTDAQKLHARLHHAGGGVAIARHNAVAERTMVHSETNSRVVGLADLEERNETATYLLYLLRIFLVSVFQLDKSTTRIDIIAGVDADLLDNLRCHISHSSIEMDVGDEGDGVAIAMDGILDLLESKGFLTPLGREAHDGGTGIDNTLDLSRRGHNIVGIRVGHRLHTDRVLATDDDIAHMAFAGFASDIVIHVSCTYSRTSAQQVPCWP